MAGSLIIYRFVILLTFKPHFSELQKWTKEQLLQVIVHLRVSQFFAVKTFSNFYFSSTKKLEKYQCSIHEKERKKRKKNPRQIKFNNFFLFCNVMSFHLICYTVIESQTWRIDSVFYVFLAPPPFLGVFIGLVQCVSSYTLSSPAFKGVTSGMNFKHTFPLPVAPGKNW